MSDPTSLLPARPSLEHLRKQAKELLRAYRAGDGVAVGRFRAQIPRLADPVPHDEMILADAQFALAREYGFENWAELVHHVAATQLAEDRLGQFEQLAEDFVAAYQGDAEALDRLNDIFPRSFTPDQLRELVRQRAGALSGGTADFALADAHLLIARQHGFESWAQLLERIAKPPSAPPTTPLGLSSTPP
jgi:hypothetical protein